MLISKEAILKWNPANRKRYVELGYQFTRWGEEFSVAIEHLTPTTRAFVIVKCDYCEKLKEITYKNYMSSRKNSLTKKDSCLDCSKYKLIETNNKIYGGNSPTCNEEVRKKVKNTTYKNYGVENILQNKDIQEKIKQTNLEKYGTENVFASPEIKEKIVEYYNQNYGVNYNTQTEEFIEKSKLTNLERYGYEYAAQSPEIKKRVSETNIKKYGVPVPTQNPQITEKIRKTLFLNNTAPLSKQQKYINELVKGELNYPEGNASIDIALINKKIAIEYDGGGHDLSVKHGNISKDDFIKKERRRQYFLLSRGWRVIRLISRKDLLPSSEIIIKLIKDAVNYLDGNRHWVEIDFDENTFKCSQYTTSLNLGKLSRKII